MNCVLEDAPAPQAMRVITHWKSTTGWAGHPTPSNEPLNKTPMQRLPCDSLEPSTSSGVIHFNKQNGSPHHVVKSAKSADSCTLPVILGQESDLVLSPGWDGSAEGHQQPSLHVAH